LASCTLQFGSNLIKIIFQGKHFNYFIVVGGWRHFFWSDTHYSISLRYTRNIVQLNPFYIKSFETFFFICIMNTITNWRVSLSKICHEWPNNTVTHECFASVNSQSLGDNKLAISSYPVNKYILLYLSIWTSLQNVIH
jgi:hypothetical protein